MRNVERRVDSEPSDTMRAPSARCGSIRSNSAKCPSTFVASTSSLPSIDSSRAAGVCTMPALATMPSSGAPASSRSAPASTASSDDWSITSVSTDAAGRAPRIAATAASSRSGLRPLSTTCAPAPASRAAVKNPSPAFAPVTR